MTDHLDLQVRLRNAEHRARRLQERLDDAHHHLTVVESARRGAEAEVQALREQKDLHSADVRSIRDNAYTELTAVRSALMLLTAFADGKTVIDE